MNEKDDPTTIEERQRLFALLAARIFIIIGLAFFGYSTYTFFFIQQSQAALEDMVLLPITFLMLVASIISFFLIRGNRFILGIWLLVSINLVIPSILSVLVLKNVHPVVIIYLTILTTILVFLVFPRASRWQVMTVAAVTILAIIGIELWNPAFRGETANLSNFTAVVIILAFLGFLTFFIRLAWRGSLRTKFLASILSIIGLTIAVFALFAVYSFQQSQTFMFDQLETAVRSQARLQLSSTSQSETQNAEETFSEIVEEIGKLAEYQATLYTQSPTLGQGTYWDANTQLTIRSGGQYGNSQSDPASVVVPSTVTLDEAMISEINTNIYLNFTVPTILASNPDIVAIYSISTSGVSIYYPNINLSEVTPPDFDPRVQPFYTIATPENNPERKAVWTEPYQDPAGNGLLVTSVAPVYDQAGKFRGIVAADIRLIAISNNISAVKVGESGFAFLIDPVGHVIGMPEAGYQMFNISPEVAPTDETPLQTVLGLGPVELQAVTRKMTAGETGLETITIQDEQFYVSYAPLSSVGYSLGIVASVKELDAPYLTARDQIESGSQTTVRLAAFILIVVLLAAAGGSLLLSQFLSGPIVRLTKVAEQVTAGNMEAQAIVESTDETGTLATAFNLMISQLRESFITLEERVAERTQNLELASEVGRSVSQVRALDVMLKDAAEIIRSRFDLYYVQVYLTNPSQTYLNLQAGTGHVGEELLARSHRLPLNTGSINGRAATEKRSVIISDTTKSATFRLNPLLPNTRSEMAVPLLIGEKIVGVLDMQSEMAGSLNQDLLSAFEALAGQLAIAIQNANLLAETEQSRAEVEAQAQRLSRTNWANYLDAIHRPEETGFVFEQNKVVPMVQGEQLMKNNSALTAPIAVTGEAIGNITVEMEGQSPISRTPELIDTVARQVAQQIESLRLLENAEQYRFEAEEASRRQTREGWKNYKENTSGSLSYLYDLREVRPLNGDSTDQHASTVPLKIRDELIGTFSIQGLSIDDKESLNLATAVAERLSTHIESLRQFDETKRGQVELDKRAQQLAAVAEISTASSKELDIDKMLASVVYLTQRKFDLYHAHIFTFDENTSMLHIAACGWKEGDEHEGTHGTTTIPLEQEQSLVARAARTRQAVIVNDVRNEPGWLPNPLLPDTSSELAVPLVIGDQVLGVLDVQSDRINAFSDEDANIQTTLASQVATALQNARSFTRAQKQAERETTLNLISQKIQSATTVDAVLQIAARELGHALGAPMTIAQLSMKDKEK